MDVIFTKNLILLKKMAIRRLTLTPPAPLSLLSQRREGRKKLTDGRDFGFAFPITRSKPCLRPWVMGTSAFDRGEVRNPALSDMIVRRFELEMNSLDQMPPYAPC